MRSHILAFATILVTTPALAEKTLIESPDAPKAIGPYSQAIQSGKLVFVSGSLPFDPDFQQALLEMNSEADRVRAVISFFERILPVLQRNAVAKRRAGGNGHLH